MSHFDVDALVAGAGAAGTSAALSAAQGGAHVVLLEADPDFRYGSNTAMSTSMIPAGGSRWQIEAAVEDSPELFLSDILRKTRGHADPIAAEALTRVAPDLVAWLADSCSVPLELVTNFMYPGHSRPRCHAVPDRGGRTLHSALLSAIAGEANIDIMLPVQLVNLEKLDGGWRASLVRPDGTDESITSRSIVLATNGFGANSAMVREFIPDAAEAEYHGGAHSQGDALLLGERLGADIANLDAYQGHGSLATPHRIILTWATVMLGAILVNRHGERFGNETDGYSEFARRVLDQPGKTAWMVYDQRIHVECEAFADYKELISVGAPQEAGSIPDLANIIGCRSEQLGATLKGMSAARASRSADGFGRYFAEDLPELEPPFFAVRVTGALFHTQGGLRVSEDAEVLSNGGAIAGLYAAGGAAVGISGKGADGYLAGNGLLSALGLGLLAGRKIARSQPS